MSNSSPGCDLFISYRHSVKDDRQAVTSIADQLRQQGVRVFLDVSNIRPFESITRTIQQELARCKALMIYLTKDYLASRACVWEMTAAFIAAQKLGRPEERIFVVNSEDNTEQLKRLPVELQDAKYALPVVEIVKEIPPRIKQINGTFQDIDPLKRPYCIGHTLTSTNRFAGRLAEMWALHSHLNASRCTLITASHTGSDIVIVSGMGGIGKTLLVEEYALKFGAAYPGGIYWLKAHGSFNPCNPDIALFKEVCKEQFLKILYAQGETPPLDTPFEYIRATVGRIIEKNGNRCLWVVDDLPFGLAGHFDLVKTWFAPTPLATTLVTTRSREYNAIGKELPLDTLNEREALELFKGHGIDLTSQMDAALALIGCLGGHAMALDIAGAVIAGYDGDIVTYVEELDQDMQLLMDVPSDLIKALPSGHGCSIITTYTHSLLKLGWQSRDYLRLAANLSPAAIPNPFAEQIFSIVDALEKQRARKFTRLAIAGCDKLSLTKEIGNSRQVHAVTSVVVQHLGWSLDERGIKIRNAVVKVLTDIVQSDMNFEETSQKTLELEHARHLTTTISGKNELALLNRLSALDYDRGFYSSVKRNYHLKNYIAWPIYKKDSKDLIQWKAKYAPIAAMIELPPPSDVLNMIPDEGAFLPPSTSQNQYIWSRCLTEMRKEMIQNCDIRICAGGKATGYKGLMPGVLEEIIIALEKSKPLFLIGGFGGVTAKVCQFIQSGKLPDELTLKWQQKHNKRYKDLLNFGVKKGKTYTVDYETIRAKLKKAQLNNGLSDKDNQKLFVIQFIDEAMYLIFKGLEKLNRFR